jgi:cytochrome c biogenesis protein CcdA
VSNDLTWVLVLGAALVDSVNPCAIGVVLFLSSALLRVSSRETLLRLGVTYVVTVYIVYMLSGLGLIWFQHVMISKGFAEIMGVFVGIFVIFLGLIEIKDFFWYGKGFSLEISPRYKEQLTQMAQRFSFFGIIAIGGFVAIVELPCTGGPYLAITAVLAKSFDSQAFVYLCIYNFVFILPLLGILFLIYLGASTLKMKQWRIENRKWMNLASGILMISLGSLLIAYYRLGWYL